MNYPVKKLRYRWGRRIIYLLLFLFILANVSAFFHAWSFTHFSDSGIKTGDPAQLTPGQKIKALFLGVSNPRPRNNTKPPIPYEEIRIHAEDTLSAWLIPADSAKGVVALFHGYAASKGSMLDKAMVLHSLHYTVFLVDFAGSGESGGNRTTIGYHEADQVLICNAYLEERFGQPVHLFGTSLGAAAIMRAVSKLGVRPASCLLECPFGTMYETTVARFNIMKVPSFPMAGLLVFWGGVQHGFWAFSHNPDEYARTMTCPVLLMQGGRDEKLSLEETSRIYEHLPGKKTLRIYPEAGHVNYLVKYGEEWSRDVREFLHSMNVAGQ